MIYSRAGLLTPAGCARVQSLFPPLAAASVNTEAGGVARKPVRQSKTAFLVVNSDEKRALITRVEEALVRANAAVFHFDISRFERLQLAEYGEGDHYGWHLDIGPSLSKFRKLSASVQLSTPEEYDGGDLELWGSAPADRSLGSVTVFPSYLLHRVTPVTRGTRRSLVVWASDASPFH